MIKGIGELVKSANGMQIDIMLMSLGLTMFLVGTIRSKKWTVSVDNRKRLNFFGPLFLASGLGLVLLGKAAEMMTK